MASPTERMSGLARHVAPDWSADREREVRARLEQAIVRRKRRQVAVTASAALLCIVTGLFAWSRAVRPDRGTPAIAERAPSTHRDPVTQFGDGVVARSASGTKRPIKLRNPRMNRQDARSARGLGW